MKLAIVGIIISSIALTFSGLSLYINWRNHQRDKPEITVNFQWNTERKYDKDGRLQESWGTVWVRNRGRRPIYIDMVAMKVPGRSYYENLLTDDVREGRRIGEGDPPLKARFYEKSALMEDPERWQEIRAVAISAGTEYLSGPGVSRPAKAQIARYQEPPAQVIEVNRR